MNLEPKRRTVDTSEPVQLENLGVKGVQVCRVPNKAVNMPSYVYFFDDDTDRLASSNIFVCDTQSMLKYVEDI